MIQILLVMMAVGDFSATQTQMPTATATTMEAGTTAVDLTVVAAIIDFDMHRRIDTSPSLEPAIAVPPSHRYSATSGFRVGRSRG